MRSARIACGIALLFSATVASANTNVLIRLESDGRSGREFFVDECLVRGLTNTIPLNDLRKWAVTTMSRYSHFESRKKDKGDDYSLLSTVPKTAVLKQIYKIHEKTPSCRPATIPKEIWETEDADRVMTSFAKKWSVTKKEAALRWSTISLPSAKPSITFYRSANRTIQAISIRWYLYSVIIGDSNFEMKPLSKPFYFEEFAPGLYGIAGYK